MNELDGKVALVTGAARGIGRATALRLADMGAAIAVNFHTRQAEAEEVAERIHQLGCKALAVRADVRDLSQVQAAVQRIAAELGPIDILVNNAGITRDKPATFMSDAEWCDVLDTSLKGAFHCIKCVSRDMARRRWGRVINISSDAGLLGDALRANYASAKAGLLGLTKAMARELAASSVTVNAVAPGFIETDMIQTMPDAKRAMNLARIPLSRFGLPSEVAELIGFLASADAAYITGQVVSVNGGLRM